MTVASPRQAITDFKATEYLLEKPQGKQQWQNNYEAKNNFHDEKSQLAT